MAKTAWWCKNKCVLIRNKNITTMLLWRESENLPHEKLVLCYCWIIWNEGRTNRCDSEKVRDVWLSQSSPCLFWQVPLDLVSRIYNSPSLFKTRKWNSCQHSDRTYWLKCPRWKGVKDWNKPQSLSPSGLSRSLGFTTVAGMCLWSFRLDQTPRY